jgi:prolyl 4-hydroxylase
VFLSSVFKWVTTKETHFIEVPPAELLEPILEHSENRILEDSDPRILSEYRVKDQPIMNMTLRALSCAPRVFEIENFLSEAEIDHILELSAQMDLAESTTGDVGSTSNGKNDNVKSEKATKTRTSFNSWVPRERSPVLDAIYRRSADLLRMDESLLRYRGRDEHPELPTKKATCESLQLVHYGPTQEYTR